MTSGEQNAPSKPIYFPGLNATRFFAALAVIINHLESFKRFAGYPNHASVPLFQAIGPQGVTFFFVLSGFLITYLLLAEQKHSSIHIGRFYLRRALRIWPVYYLIVVLAFFCLPGVLSFPPMEGRLGPDFFKKLAYYSVLLPNVAFAAYGHILFLGPLWSIGVEEQFYLVWPWLMRFAHRRMYLVLGGVIATLVIIRWIWASLHGYALWWAVPAPYQTASKLLYLCRFECMALGGLGATLLFHQKTLVLAFLYRRAIQYFVYLLALLFVNTKQVPSPI